MRAPAPTLACLLLLLAGLAGCVPLSPAARPADAIELSQTPFYPQEEFQCGPASLAMLLEAAGVHSSPEALREQVYLPARHGSLQAELLAAARRHDRLPYVIDPTAAALRAQLAAGAAVLVLENLGSARQPLWHYAVVIGYESGGGAYLLRSGVTRRQRLPARRFLAIWERAGNWGMVLAEPGQVPRDAEPTRYLQAAAALARIGPPAQAVLLFEAARRQWPSEPAAWFALAGAQLSAGQPDAAEASLRALLAIAPEHAPARNNLALLLLQRGCVAAARTQLEAARATAGPRFAADIADTAAEIDRHAGPAAPPASCTAP